MPLKTVRVRDHHRHRPRSLGLTHVDKYTRKQITGSRQYDLEESLGPQHDILSKNDPEGEVCARCGWQRPVHQRDISGQPICRECHDSHYQGQIKRRVEHRSEASKQQDLRLEAEDTGLIDDKEHVQEWKRAPNQHDIAGVDDTLYGPKLEDLAVVRQVLRERFAKFSRVSREIVSRARARAQAIKKSKKLPAREKKKRILRIRKETKKEVAKAAKKDLEDLKKHEKLVHRVTRAVKKWSAERRRRANYVAETTKCSTIQADSLIRRAHLKGWDYDTVDWDQLQGKDLQYDERVGKLEQMIGKTYTEGEYDSAIKSEQERWKGLLEERRKEVEAIGEHQGYRPEDYEVPPQAFGYS